MNEYKKIKGVQDVFIRGNEIIITGCPDEDDDAHSCDEMGCGSCDHILFHGLLRLSQKGYSEVKQDVAVGDSDG